MNKLRILSAACLTVAAASVISSCGDKRSTGWEFARNMYDPIAYNPDQPNKNFSDGKTAQLPPEGTMPIGFDDITYKYPDTPEGLAAAEAELHNPYPADKANINEGQKLYLSYCSHCHGVEGHGDGQMIQNGKFPPPPSYATGNSSRGGAMKDMNDGRIYHTITYGLNLMGPHASQITPEQRWKIVMYVHELQKK